MSTTISDALTEYSHQRAGLIPRATFASYQRRGRPALSVRVIDRGKHQERGDEPVDPYAAEIGRAVVAGAGRTGQERRRDRERGGRRDREQDDRLQCVHRADDDVQTAQPGGRRGVELGWRAIGHVPKGTVAEDKQTPRAREGDVVPSS